MVSGTKASTWWRIETDGSNYPAKVRHDVGPHTWFEEHNYIGVILVVALEYTRVHWLKSVVVEMAWQK